MRHFIVLLIIMLNSAIGFAQYAEFQFLNEPNHPFGKVDEGIQLKHYFVFKNVGEIPLIIDTALVSCSCTKIDFPKHPVLPQQKDSILVRFDTNQKYYQQDRIIKLKANTKRQQKLRIKAYVVPKED